MSNTSKKPLEDGALAQTTGGANYGSGAVCPRSGANDFKLDLNSGGFLDCRCKDCSYTVGIPKNQRWDWPRRRNRTQSLRAKVAFAPFGLCFVCSLFRKILLLYSHIRVFRSCTSRSQSSIMSTDEV